MDIDEYRFAHPHTYTDICAEKHIHEDEREM